VRFELDAFAAAVPYTQIESGISRVTAGVLLAHRPAAALRGFGVGFLPSATSRSFSLRKPDSGM
jgi:hypothetical protein